QSRPITTLFPIPAQSDRENHVYVSVGHGQMMTDPMKPLGLSVWQLTAGRPMFEAGGRLVVDVTRQLASPASRAGLLGVMRRGDPGFTAAMEAGWWLNDQLQAWLGEKNAADTLTQSVPNNITSEMGLALLDVADVIRPHPDVVAFLEHVEDQGFLAELPRLEGGRESRDAIGAWLDKYGMRCVGEIDITRARWSERPTTLLPMLLGNIKNFEPGAGERRFEQGQQEAWKKEQELLERLLALPDGERKAEESKRMIDRVRTFIGYREYPKYGMVSRYFVYKQALLEEAQRLVQAHVLREKEDD